MNLRRSSLFNGRTVLAVLALLLAAVLFSCAPDKAEPASEETSETVSAHSHEYVDTVIEPTCITGGYTVHKCVCGDEYTDSYTPKQGHKVDYIKEESHLKLLKSDDKYVLAVEGPCSLCNAVVTRQFASVEWGLDTKQDNKTEIDVPVRGGRVSALLGTDGAVWLTAVPDDYFSFSGWSDGESSLERRLEASSSESDFLAIEAIFGFSNGNMAVININTEASRPVTSLTEYLDCNITVTNCDKKFAMNDIEAGIRVRGNASANYGDISWILSNKVHYRLKFSSKHSLLGINDNVKCKSWVFLRGDSCFTRETTSFFMGAALLGDNYFVPDYTFANLYFNYQYMGAYVICDQIQVNPNRIDIDEQEEDETYKETGYLLELDHYYRGEEFNFLIDYGRVSLTDMYGRTYRAPEVGYSVKKDSMTDEQLDFIRKYVSDTYFIVYQAIWEEKYYKFDSNYNVVPANDITSSEDAVGRVMDINSLVGMYILHELCAERDVGVGSFFMYVDFSKDTPLLTFCAPWDFSWAFGDGDGFRYDRFTTAGWQPEEFISYASNRSSTWFITLYHAEWFREAVMDKWTKAAADGLFDALITERERISDDYEYEFAMNSKRWAIGEQRAAQIRITNWLKQRIKWLDTQWLRNN